MSDLQALGEFGWIARQNRALSVRGGVVVGIGDDASVLETLRAPVVTCDCLVENIHFRFDWSSPRQLGRKALSVNVSDLAAMGAQPVAAFVSLAIPAHLGLDFWDEFYGGLEEIAARFGFTIAGGDTSRSPGPLFINITLVGEGASESAIASVSEGVSETSATPILRSGARIGDVLIVTGSLGDAAAGLWLLQNPASNVTAATREWLLQRHLDPTARLDEMQAALSLGGVRAALDLSDGLAGDAAHIARTSGVSLQIKTNKLPISYACRGTAQLAAESATGNAAESAIGNANRVLDKALHWALSGGEDYELLLCVAPEVAVETALNIARQTGTRATIIGRCIESAKNQRGASENRVVLLDKTGHEITAPRAWTHF